MKDIEEALRTWPSPETRDALNETIQLMTEDVLYVSEAKKRNIDKGMLVFAASDVGAVNR